MPISSPVSSNKDPVNLNGLASWILRFSLAHDPGECRIQVTVVCLANDPSVKFRSLVVWKWLCVVLIPTNIHLPTLIEPNLQIASIAWHKYRKCNVARRIIAEAQWGAEIEVSTVEFPGEEASCVHVRNGGCIECEDVGLGVGWGTAETEAFDCGAFMAGVEGGAIEGAVGGFEDKVEGGRLIGVVLG